MGDKTAIQWADATWNPVTGCSKVSPGCKNCYAEAMSLRLRAMGAERYKNGFAVTLHEDALRIPVRWKKPRRIFVNSMSDLFHKDVPFWFIDEVLITTFLAWQHTYLILTKRPERMHEYLTSATIEGSARNTLLSGGQLQNVWFGTSIEDQNSTDARLPWMHRIYLDTSIRNLFLSAEPLLQSINFGMIGLYAIRWLIVGGESGAGARAMDRHWLDHVIDQSRASNVPVFVKQMGSVWASWYGYKHRKGGDPTEWDEMYRIREMPE